MSAESSLLVSLDAPDAGPALVGGKGAWLARLVAAGFDVPVSVAVTTEAYRSVAALPEVAALIASLVEEPVPAPEDFAGAEGLVDDVFLAAPLPAAVKGAIVRAAAQCRSGATGPLVARSSATAEDMTTTSFAGQYRSFIGLRTDAELEHAVRLVWASLWYPAPRAYRRYHGVDESDLAMAVVIMPMVPAEHAGVAFTVDPGGRPDAVRVETVRGLGEQLVAGKVTPHVDLVPRTKSRRAPGDGNDALATAVADLALAVESALGGAQDIEWAWDGRRIVLLQARPITTGATPRDDGYDTPSNDDEHWTTAGIGEMLPGALPPLQWETIGFMLEEAFRQLFDDLHALPLTDEPTRILGRFRARAALSMTLLEQVAQVLPGGSPDDIEQQYFGRSAGERPSARGARRTGGLRTARHDLTVLRVRRRAVHEAETVIAATDELCAGPLRLDGSTAELHHLRRRLLDVSCRAVAAETAVAATAGAAYRRLEDWLARRFEHREAERWAQRLTTGVRGGVGWIEALSDAAAASGEFTATLSETAGWDEAEQRLASTSEGHAALVALMDHARRAGSAGVFAGPTWDEQMDQVWVALRATSARRNADSPGANDEVWPELVTALEELSSWQQSRPLTGGRLDPRLTTARRLRDDAVELLDRRERTKAGVLALGGLVRRVHLELGRRLFEQGLLEQGEDVHLLGERELLDTLEGVCPALAELGRRRRWLERCASEGPLPDQFQGRPGPPAALDTTSGSRFPGWGAGPGVYRGRARVIREPTESIERGDVLVADSTDASWSPLFLLAGAIVVERGGPLSHAAIVARELGIPAVLNVPGIVERLEGGEEVVTVDGDRGVVVVGP